MARRSALAIKSEIASAPATDFRVRSGAYGGLVGQMIDDIDSRMAVAGGQVQASETPEDFVHGISVACGYVGLVAGFAVAGLALLRIV